MFTDSLFEKILIAPVRENADTLYIVSGYARATMVSRHFTSIKRKFRVELIVGMAIQDGISDNDHKGFQELSHEYGDSFVCRYVAYRPPVHSKTYAWYEGNSAKIAYTGSANYTQGAFGNSRREAMVEHDAEQARGYYDLVLQDTVDCHDPRVSEFITIYNEPRYSIGMASEDEEEAGRNDDINGVADDLAHLPHVNVSFLNKQGKLPQRSGLNWGQRPEEKREPNQAYIRLTSAHYNSGFFPPRGHHFTIITDDNKTLICRRAQDNGKAIHTPDSNSRMGLYFRYRLGVAEGKNIDNKDLENYGRTDVDFYKIDDETYYMDFSV